MQGSVEDPIIVSKVVEIDTSKKSFVYFDDLDDGTFRVVYTKNNADIVRMMRDNDVIVEGQK